MEIIGDLFGHIVYVPAKDLERFRSVFESVRIE